GERAARGPQGEPGQLGEEAATHAVPPLRREDEQVLEVEGRARLERREREEVEREPDGAGAVADLELLRQERLEDGPGPEAVAVEEGLRRLHLVAEPLVLTDAVDQAQDRGDVGRGRGPDREGPRH